MEYLLKTLIRLMVLPFALLIVTAMMSIATIAALVVTVIKIFSESEVKNNETDLSDDELSSRREAGSVH